MFHCKALLGWLKQFVAISMATVIDHHVIEATVVFVSSYSGMLPYTGYFQDNLSHKLYVCEIVNVNYQLETKVVLVPSTV